MVLDSQHMTVTLVPGDPGTGTLRVTTQAGFVVEGKLTVTP
jgi:hypothetical protein